jgi:hypothetical protein
MPMDSSQLLERQEGLHVQIARICRAHTDALQSQRDAFFVVSAALFEVAADYLLDAADAEGMQWNDPQALSTAIRAYPLESLMEFVIAKRQHAKDPST